MWPNLAVDDLAEVWTPGTESDLGGCYGVVARSTDFFAGTGKSAALADTFECEITLGDMRL